MCADWIGPKTDWIATLRRVPVDEVARRLKLEVGRKDRLQCPLCNRDDVCGIFADFRQWYCHHCDVGGDSADLVSAAVVGHTLHRASPADYVAVRAHAAALKFVGDPSLHDEDLPSPAPKGGDSTAVNPEPWHLREALLDLRHRLSEEKCHYPWPGVALEPPPAISRGALLPSGETPAWKQLHKLVGPWFPGRLCVLVGDIGVGKTAWAVQVGESASRSGAPVLYVSAEFDRTELAARLLSLRSRGRPRIEKMQHGVPWSMLLGLESPPDELDKAEEALLDDCSTFYVWDPPPNGRTMPALHRMARAVSIAHGGAAPLIIIDYVQRWGKAEKNDSPPFADHPLSESLRMLSRPSGSWPGAAILALSNSSSDTTSELELDAALVLELTSEPGEDDLGARGAKLRVVKNRHGHVGSVRCRFVAAVGRFYGEPPSREE